MLSVWLFSCQANFQKYSENSAFEKQRIGKVLDQLNAAASTANFEDYFNLFSEDAFFIGTDASEKWNILAFKTYAKPHFDKGKAWSFVILKREIFLSKDGQMAWFDELLDTRMKICRGSGVLTKINNKWKISQYVLSMTVPNDNSDEVIKIKTFIENKQIEDIKKGD